MRGFSLIELLVGIAVLALLLVAAAPSFTTWIQNAQIRTATDATLAGLQLARAEAIRRNTSVRFQLTTTLDSSCAMSTSGTNWVVSLDDPSGACDSAASDTTAPRIIQTRAAQEGSRNAAITADQASIVYNALGRLTPAPGAGINIDFTNPTGGTCAATGPMRCLRIVLSTGGQIRMCDPALASTSPQGC